MKYKPKQQKLYLFSKINEAGRSMVEILGVLAVIGVISIGGIMGYTYAMERYQANDIINEVNMRGQDTWNRYHEADKTLPDEITEWADKTSVGFPIVIQTLPEENMFFVEVEDVSSRVCKLVLQGQYDSIYAMVAQGDEAGSIYNGDVEICDTAEEATVQMLFAFDLEGEYNPNPKNNRLCITDIDCGSACKFCNREKHICETGCEGSKGICATTGVCVECETNADCSRGICNELTNTCDIPPTQCANNEFRSSNGACIPCSYPANMLINKDEKFDKDTQTGAEMCASCEAAGTQRLIETSGLGTDNEKTYCSYTCTRGISYQNRDGACVPCDDSKHHIITEDQEAQEQCLACKNHMWYQSLNNVYFCGPKINCAAGEVAVDINGQGISCQQCSSNSKFYLIHEGRKFSDSNLVQTMLNMCNNCPERVDGVWTKRYGYNEIEGATTHQTTCYKECEQPISGSEADTICKTDPNSPKCTRKWQTAKGVCRPCNYKDSDSNIAVVVSSLETSKTYSHLKKLCEDCGRKVNNQGFCVPKNVVCEEGFMGADGKCYPCSQEGLIEVANEMESGCSTKCKETLPDGTTIDKRWILSAKKNDKTDTYYCAPKCAADEFQDKEGVCYSCSEDEPTKILSDSRLFESTDLKNLCTKCDNREAYMGLYDTTCSKKDCLEENGEKKFQGADGTCYSCDETTAPVIGKSNNGLDWSSFKQTCERCGNRLVFLAYDYAYYKCALINPGTSGICNSKTTELSDNVANDLKEQATSYINGNYDGVKFRIDNGNCADCTASNSVTTNSSQCNSCGNRRFDNGDCSYGLCAAGEMFYSLSGRCLGCSDTNYNYSVRIPDGVGSENLCNSCTDRRAFTTGTAEQSNLKTYCVPKCLFNNQFQDINGKCYDDSEEDDLIEIGSDKTSKDLCDSISNRTVIENNGIFYCKLQ